MATYPGNASLSSAVKDRVLSTFQQTLTLYKEGRSAEVVEGCTLILRMDPTFDPARKLLEKTRNPNAAVDVDSLLPADSGSALSEAHAALLARDFQRAADLTSEVLREDFTNEEARLLNDTAREKMEAAPFVEQFIRKAEMFAKQGNAGAARAELEKARALDDGNPGIRRVAESMQTSGPAASFNAGASPSFVVEAPPPAATNRGAAQATDFGFTFEEEKPAVPESPFGGFSFDSPAPAPPPPPASGGFSFDAPAAPPPAAPSSPFGGGGFSFDSPAAAPAGGGFDFAPAPSAASGDDQRKIQQYLADGDRAANAGDYQQAIDLWSRIFLIDVTNDEASHRIESAKAKRREIENRVDAIIAAGEQAYNARDNDKARAKFNEALQLDPGNLTAHDYLERITNASGKPAPAIEPTFAASPAPRGDIFDDDSELSGSYDSLKPPEIPAPKKAVAAKAPAAPAPAKRGGRMGVLVTIVAVVVVAAAGWFVWSKYMAKPAYDPSATQAIFRQADMLAKKNRYDQAIAALRDVKPSDPQHDKALEMIADLQHKKAQAAEMVGGRPSAVVYEESIAAGRAAYDGHDYEAAKTAFDTAARIKPLPPDVSVMYAAASQQVAKLEVAKGLFSEQKYQDAITNLEPLLAADPQNQSIRRLITNAHFNLGAIALQEERLPDALHQFDEVLKNDPNDELAKRSRTLADRYSGQQQQKDLLYKIYVKYLPLRKP